MCQVTTDNASNFVKSFTKFQPREQGSIQMVMEKEVDETTTARDNLVQEETEKSDEEEEGDTDSDREEEAGRKKKGLAEDLEDINIKLEDQEEPQMIEATEILQNVTNTCK